MKHQRLLDLRAKKIITIPEFMIFKNFYFGNWDSFKQGRNLKNLRKIYASGMTKILKYKKLEIAQNL